MKAETLIKKVKELDQKLSSIEEYLNTKLNERFETLEKEKCSQDNYNYLHRELREFKEKMKEELKDIEDNFATISECFKVLTAKDQMRCSLCEKIIFSKHYLGIAKSGESKIVCPKDSYGIHNALPICENCAKKDINTLAVMYFEKLKER